MNNEPIDQVAGENELCINMASFLPMSVLGPYVEQASARLRDCGYNSLCLLPLRGLVCPDEIQLSLPVHFIERAWNPTEASGLSGLIEVINGMRTGNPKAPKIHDFIAFPNKFDSGAAFYEMAYAYRSGDKLSPTLTEVVHEFPGHPISGAGTVGADATILEINPGLNMSPQQILDRISVENSMIPNVDIDTSHIRRGLRTDEVARLGGSAGFSNLGKWQDVIHMFSTQRRIGLVDFQAKDPQELSETLNGGNTELDEMIDALLETGYKGPIRVEFNMGLLRQVQPGYAMGIARDSHDYLRHKTGGFSRDIK